MTDRRRVGRTSDDDMSACRAYDTAVAAAGAYERLQASPGTLEYQIAWTQACRREAAAAAKRARVDPALAAARAAAGPGFGPAATITIWPAARAAER
jgi:hypothetical protein